MLSGFLAAIGILVIFKQIIPALGGDPETGGIIDAVVSWPEAARALNLEALALSLICLALAVLWRGRLRRLAPSYFIALVVRILAGVLLFPGAPTVGRVPSSVPSPQLSAISLEFFCGRCHPHSSWPFSDQLPLCCWPFAWTRSLGPRAGRTRKCLPRG